MAENRQPRRPYMVCDNCEHEWRSRTLRVPSRCPQCGSTVIERMLYPTNRARRAIEKQVGEIEDWFNGSPHTHSGNALVLLGLGSIVLGVIFIALTRTTGGPAVFVPIGLLIFGVVSLFRGLGGR